MREYWIAAVDVPWDVVPNGRDAVTGRVIPDATRRLTAVVYRRFTPGWRRPYPMRPSAGDGAGIPGTVIRARVGDDVVVHFANRDRVYGLPHSVHVHGLRYRPASDGAFIPYVSGPGADVPVGHRFTYRYQAMPDSAGVWPYHDHSPSMMRSIDLGLVGAVVVLQRGERPPDRRFFVLLGAMQGLDTVDGRAFIGNTPTFHARVGDEVEFDVMAIGESFHVFHVHGHRWLRDGTPVDSETLGPSESIRVRWREDNPGTWYYHCHVESHQDNGMIGLYRVSR